MLKIILIALLSACLIDFIEAKSPDKPLADSMILKTLVKAERKDVHFPDQPSIDPDDVGQKLKHKMEVYKKMKEEAAKKKKTTIATTSTTTTTTTTVQPSTASTDEEETEVEVTDAPVDMSVSRKPTIGDRVIITAPLVCRSGQKNVGGKCRDISTRVDGEEDEEDVTKLPAEELTHASSDEIKTEVSTSEITTLASGKASSTNMNNAETAPGVPLVQAVIYTKLTCAQGLKEVSGKCQAIV